MVFECVVPILWAMSEFGGLIRDARQRLGLSPGRVADLIGRASGTVRAWERGRTVPHDPVVVTSLAAVLAIDETELFEAAGLAPPGVAPHRTIEQELASIAPHPDPQIDEEPTAQRAGVITGEHPVAPAEEVIDPDAEQEAAMTAFFGKAVESIKQIQWPSFDRSDRTAPTRTTTQAAPRVAAQPWTTTQQRQLPASYMEDAEERWSYRLRAVWTAAALGALVIVLLWAGGNLLQAFGDAWHSVLSGL